MTEMQFRKKKLLEAIEQDGGEIALYRIKSGYAIIIDDNMRSWIYQYSKYYEYWSANCYFDTYKEAVNYLRDNIRRFTI